MCNNTKVCSKCGIERELELFEKRYNKCKICQKEYRERFYQENKERILDNSKKYYQKNKDNILIRCKKYVEENKDKTKEYKKEYRQKNSDRLKDKAKLWRQENKDKIDAWKQKNKEYDKVYRQKNAEIIALRLKEYRDNNKDKIAEWRQKNAVSIAKRVSDYQKRLRKECPDKLKGYHKNWLQKNPDYSCLYWFVKQNGIDKDLLTDDLKITYLSIRKAMQNLKNK